MADEDSDVEGVTSILTRLKNKWTELREKDHDVEIASGSRTDRKLLERDPLIEQKLEGAEKLFPVEDSAWKRVRSLLFRDATYSIWPVESLVTLTSSLTVFSVGFVGGGLRHNKDVIQLFRRQHAATAFISKGDAVRRLFDYTLVMFCKNGFKRGARMATVTFLTMATTAAITAATNTLHPAYFSVGGGIAGLAYCFPRGPAAMLVGGVVGFTTMLLGGFGVLVPIKMYSGLSYKEMYRLGRVEYFEERLKWKKDEQELIEFMNKEQYLVRRNARKEIERRKELALYAQEEEEQDYL